MKNNTDYLVNMYRQKGKTILVGFSLGTLGALEITSKVNVDKLILISPSAIYFDSHFSKKEMGEFVKSYDKTLSYYLKPIIDQKDIVIYYGEKEHEKIKATADKMAKYLGIEAKEVKGVGHTPSLIKKVLKIEEVK